MNPKSKVIEKQIRDKVVAFVDHVLTVPADPDADPPVVAMPAHVFGRRRFITSKHDFVEKLGQVQSDTRTEVYFAEVEFLRFANDPQRGGDDCPSMILYYGIRLFRQFNDGRADGSNSDEQFTGAVLDLRDAFIEAAAVDDPADNPFSPGVLEGPDNLTMPENAQFGRDELDVVGHAADLVLEILWHTGGDSDDWIGVDE